MSLTVIQLKELGFKESKKSTGFSKKFITLVYPLNHTDYLYFGYDDVRKQMNNKIIWKSFVEPDTGNRISYMVTKIGHTGYNEMKAFLRREHMNANYKPIQDDLTTLINDTTELFIKLQENGEDVEESDEVFTKIK